MIISNETEEAFEKTTLIHGLKKNQNFQGLPFWSSG